MVDAGAMLLGLQPYERADERARFCFDLLDHCDRQDLPNDGNG